MLVKRLIIDGKTVLAIRFDDDDEEHAFREMAGKASEVALNVFMEDTKTAVTANNILVGILYALDGVK